MLKHLGKIHEITLLFIHSRDRHAGGQNP